MERPDLKVLIEPLLASAAMLSMQIKRLDGEVEAQAEVSPLALLLRTIPGVGPIVSLAHAATMDDPGRFSHSRAVGAYTNRQ